jgi:hypothetical protein
MFYRVSLEVLGLRSHLKEGDEIEFPFAAPDSVVVRIGRSYPDGGEPSEPSSAVVIGVIQEGIAVEDVASALDTALSTSLDGIWANFRGVPADQMRAVYEVIDAVFGPPQKAMRDTVSVLRWREGLMGDPINPFRRMREHCSLDGERWLEIGAVRSATLRYTIGPAQMSASDELRDEIVDLVENGTEEPLGQQLFREAWNLRVSNPRSALAIGVAAAEVGLKKLIGSLVPQAQWLVDEIQTPPIALMLRKFLPTLPVRLRFKGKSICPPSKVLKKLDEAVHRRNDLVHAGKSPPSGDELEEMLSAIYDFLCVCDVYAGYGWAQRYISRDTLNAWKDEEPSQAHAGF